MNLMNIGYRKMDKATKIFLVSCVKTKQNSACEVSQLYTSDWFQKAKEYTERHCDKWYILFAKYGLIQPDEVLEPYEETLNTKKKPERIAWAEKVISDLEKIISLQDEVTVLAGLKYREFLKPWPEVRGNKVVIPLEGLRSGEQNRGFNENQ